VRRLLPLVILALVACTRSPASDLGLSAIAEPLPALSGETLQGGAVTPADYRGRVVVVNFWATWCGPCRREQPALQRLWERFESRGVYFLGVDTRDDPAAARAWIEEFGVTYPSIQDASGAYADDFAYVGLPDTYVADRSGTMRYQVLGEIDPDELARAIEDVLATEG